MKKTTNTLPVLFIMIIIYFLLKYIIPYGKYIIYPVNLLVTFMHEFGHAFFALITGGSVGSLQVNTDGSGVTSTSGGWRIFILMGGYLGSALFGNILLYFGLKQCGKSKHNISEIILYLLAGIMLLSSIIWFSNIASFLIMLVISGVIIFLAKKTHYDNLILQFLGVASLLFIIEDFNVGPSSDLSKFSEIFIVIPQSIWMIIWLILVLVITGFNIKNIYKK